MTPEEAAARAIELLKLEPVPPPAPWIYCKWCGWIGGGHHPQYPSKECGKDEEK